MRTHRATRPRYQKTDFSQALAHVERRLFSRGMTLARVTVPTDVPTVKIPIRYCDQADLRLLLMSDAIDGYDRLVLLLGFIEPSGERLLSDDYVGLNYPEPAPEEHPEPSATWRFYRGNTVRSRQLVRDMSADLLPLCLAEGEDPGAHYARCLELFGSSNLQAGDSPLFMDLIDRVLDRMLLGAGKSSRITA